MGNAAGPVAPKKVNKDRDSASGNLQPAYKVHSHHISEMQKK